MTSRSIEEVLGLRFERPSPWVRAALACALAALWLLGRRYAGITHDATLYVAQGLHRLDASSLSGDFFFAHGSQDDYTVFPRLYAPLIDIFGAGPAAMLVTVAGQAAFFAAAAALVFRMGSGHVRWWSLALLAAISGYYGGDGTFRIAEPFATARTLAEPLVIAAVVCTLAARHRLAIVALAAAALLHPLVAAPGIAVIFLWHAAARRGLLWSVSLFAVLAAGLALALPGSALRFDSSWLEAVLERSPHLFMARWEAPDWARVLWGMCSVWLALRFIDEQVRRLAIAAVAAALAGIALSWIAVDLFENVLVAGLQLWRAHWLMHLLAVLLVPISVAGLWKRGNADRVAGALIAASCCFGRSDLPTAALLAVLAVAFDASERRWPNWMGEGSLRIALLAAIGAASVGLLFEVQSHLPLEYGAPQPRAWTDYLPAAGSIGGLLPLALLLWLAACSRMALAAAVLAVVTFAGSIAIWDGRTPWSRFIEQASERPNPFRKAIVPHGQVFWPDPNAPVWLTLRTPTWFSVDQGAGIVFGRATAIEYAARKAASENLRGRIQNCAMAGRAGCRIEGWVAAELCGRKGGPDYLVTNGRIDGHSALADWPLPPEVRSGTSMLFLYSCRALAG